MNKRIAVKMISLAASVILLAACFISSADPLVAMADKTLLDISYGNITIGADMVSGFSHTGAIVEIANPDGYRITGITSTYTIQVTGGSHDIVLDDLRIDTSGITDAYAMQIQSNADVNLTLSGENELTSGGNRAGLQVPAGASVGINGSGSLLAQGGTYGAGIGGGRAQNSGNITILAGDVSAQGGNRGAGIGGGGNVDGGTGNPGGVGGSGGTITISGGNVTAAGGDRGAGIGGGGGGDGGYRQSGGNGGNGGGGGSGGTISILGGNVTTAGGDRGAGIGGGGGGNGGGSRFYNGGNGGAGGGSGTITIVGGVVESSGAYSGAGIGSGGYGGGGGSDYGTAGSRGSGGTVGTISLRQTDVDARGGDYSAGIGGGAGGGGGVIIIENAIVKSQSSAFGAGIGGGGMNGNSGLITISDSSIEAQSLSSGAGIGGGSGGSTGPISIANSDISAQSQSGSAIGGAGSSTITIEKSTVSALSQGAAGIGGAGGTGREIIIVDSEVIAQGVSNGAGIGGGTGGSAGTITLITSIVTTQSQNGAGIGGGSSGSGGIINITNSTVIAQSSAHGAGIGGGSGGSTGPISIANSDISAQSQSGSAIGGAGGSTITIEESTVSAISQGAAGIGGAGGTGREIIIVDSRVIAQGVSNGAGIGGGSGGSGGVIRITNSTVNAQSNTNGAGIGGGLNGSGGTITLITSIVTTQSQNGAGIGGGLNGSGGTITINSSTIIAQSQNGAGIGGGRGGNGSGNEYNNAGNGSTGGSGGLIAIENAMITARSITNGAGIGGGAGGNGGGSTFANGGSGGAGGSGGTITIKNATVDAQSGVNGAGIGGGTGGNGGGSWHGYSGTGGAGGSGGTITIEDSTLIAQSSVNGAGIGGGTGGSGGSTNYYGSANGGMGGAGGEITIRSGQIAAAGITGIGGGAGGSGGNGISHLSGSNGGRGGNGGSGGKTVIEGGNITVPGTGNVLISGGSGGSGGAGGSGSSGAAGGNGGNGGVGGDVTITGGTIAPSGSGTSSGIGGGRGGNGGNGGNASAGSSGRGPNGSAGTASTLVSSVITGGSVNARITCTPTTGGDNPVDVFFTVARFKDAERTAILSLSLMQEESLLYGIQDMTTDAEGRLYLYLPAYDEVTAAEISTASFTFSDYYGSLHDTATFENPNTLKQYQSTIFFTSTIEKSFIFGDEIELDYEVDGGTLSEGIVSYSYAGTDFSTDETYSDRLNIPVNAGNYLLKATLSGDDYYHDVVATKPFLILAKSIAGFSVDSISPVIYSGTDAVPNVIMKDGAISLISGKDYTVACEDVDVGIATARITGMGNYQGSLERSFQIVPKEIAMELTAVPSATMVHENVVLTAGIIGPIDLPTGTVTFKYNDVVIEQDVTIRFENDAFVAETIWENVPAGAFTLTADYSPSDNDNYVCVSNGQITSYQITKYEQSDFAFANGADYTISEGVISKTYGDDAFMLQTQGKLSAGSAIFTVLSGDEVISVDQASGEVSILKSGTAMARVLSPSDQTYNETSAIISIKVAKAEQVGFGFADLMTQKTYGDEPFVIEATGGQSIGDITYSITDGFNAISLDDSGTEVTVTIRKAGTAVITATKAADDRYNEVSAQWILEVEKAVASVISTPTASNIQIVGILSSSTLSGGESITPGRFIWTDPDLVVTATGMREVTFIPDDTTNYVRDTCNVNVRVMTVLSHRATGIELDFSKIRLPDNVTSVSMGLSIESTNGPVFATISNQANMDPDYSVRVLVVYDLNLFDQNGESIADFVGTIMVRMPVPAGASGNLQSMWYDPVSESLTDMNARLENGYLVFDTTHFSYYAIMEFNEIVPETVVIPRIGERNSGHAGIVFALLSILFVLRLGILIKKKK